MINALLRKSKVWLAYIPIYCSFSAIATVPVWATSAVGTFLDNTRLHAHMHLPYGKVGEPGFYTVRSRMEGLGVRTYTRLVKGGLEAPWWTMSSFPFAVAPESGYNANQTHEIVRSFFDSSDGRSQSIIGYYWLASDTNQLAAHPEWGAKRLDGSTAEHDSKGPELDISSKGYQDYLVARFKEMAAMGAKGVYLDNRHGNGAGVFGTELEVRYAASYGTGALPSEENINTDADYIKYLEFNANEVAAALKRVRNRVTEVYPDFKFIVSCTTLPSLMHPLMHSRLAMLADAPKIEFRLPVSPDFLPAQVLNDMQTAPYATISARMAYGVNLLRTASDSMPHVWGHDFVNADHYRGFVVSTLCFGGIANLDLENSFVLAPPSTNPRSRSLSQTDVNDLFALGERLSPGFKDLSPMKYVAVYHSEALRSRYSAALITGWRTAIAPPLMAYAELSRWGVPCSVVTDDIVGAGGLSGYACLFVADRANLPTLHQQKIAEFAAAGGRVYDVTISVPNRILSSASAADVITVKNSSPVYRTVASAPIASVFTNAAKNRITVAITNPVSWIQENRTADDGTPKFLNYNAWGLELGAVDTPNSPPNSFSNMKVFVKTDRTPVSVRNHYNGNVVTYSNVPGGIRLNVPSFVYGSVIEIRF